MVEAILINSREIWVSLHFAPQLALVSHPYIPEKSGFPSVSRGAGAVMSTTPSALRGAPAVGYCTHWAIRSDEAERIARQPTVANAPLRRRRDPGKKVKANLGPAYNNARLSRHPTGLAAALVCHFDGDSRKTTRNPLEAIAGATDICVSSSKRWRSSKRPS